MSATTTSDDERVRLLAKLGAGGMADVFLGLQVGEQDFSRFVVVKKVHARHMGDEQALGMFFDEARTIAQLNHPHIVKIFDLQRLANEVCLTMEYVDGEALSYVMTRLRSGARKFPPAIVCKLVLDALDALAYAHGATHNDGTPLKLVHRDISPQNLMVDQNGYVKVIDFGIAKTTMQTELTSPGGIKGKVTYLAPESFTQRDIDHRVDVYALGIVLWECLTLRKALAIRDAPMQEVMDAVCNLALEPASEFNALISSDLDDVVKKAVSSNREERYQDCESFALELRSAAMTSVGIASANEVAAWFRSTFQSRLEKRKAFEQDALARLIDDQAQAPNDDSEVDLPTAAALVGDAAAIEVDIDAPDTEPGSTTPGSMAIIRGASAMTPAGASAPRPSLGDEQSGTFAPTTQTLNTLTAQVAAPKNPYIFLGFLFLLFVVGALVVRFLFFADSDATNNVAVTSTIIDPSLVALAVGLSDAGAKVAPETEPLPDGSAPARLPDGSAPSDMRVEVVSSPDTLKNARKPRRKSRRRRRQSRGESTVQSADTEKTNPSPSVVVVNEPESPPAQPSVDAPPDPSPTPTPSVAPPNPTPLNNVKNETTKTPVVKRNEPETKLFSGSGNWSGTTVVDVGCKRCHNAKKARKLVLTKKTTRQWQRFFSRHQHKKHGELSRSFSKAELRRALSVILKRIENDTSYGIAGAK